LVGVLADLDSRRKVKCQENHPRCAQCVRLGLNCEYPKSVDTPMAINTRLFPTGALTSDLTELGLFHHFMFAACPPVPLGCDEFWHEMAGIAFNYDFLYQAILGLAASHRGLSTREDHRSRALTYRVHAINMLNDKLSQPCENQQDGDALLSAVVVLRFQAALLPDALMEFITFCRGCDLVMARMMPNPDNSKLRGLAHQSHAIDMSLLIRAQGEGSKDPEQLEQFSVSLDLLSNVCHSKIEQKYLKIMKEVVETARSSLADGKFLSALVPKPMLP